MANQEHLDILKQGIDVWNKWREEHPEIQPDLREADITCSQLMLINFIGVDLYKANLSASNLIGAKLIRTNLEDANLSKSSLRGANFMVANLRGANLSRAGLWDTHYGNHNVGYANLTGADLSNTDLGGLDFGSVNFSGASFREAYLGGVDLGNSILISTDFTSATMNGTFLGDRDLRLLKGLDTVQHNGPSPLSIRTIYLSEANIPEVFLRGTGVPDSFIEYTRSLVTKPIDFCTCFISYSSKDQDFAERLYADLKNKGVLCWYAPEDLKIGDRFADRIEESIRIYDKLLIVLSKNSVNSTWVEDEYRAALEKEQQLHKTVLFPIKLDETIKEATSQWVYKIRRERHIGDFTDWKNHDSYQTAFERLMRDLKV